MAKLKVHLEVEGATSPKAALGLAQEAIAVLKARLKNTEIEGKVKLACPGCGKPMRVEGREIVCPACIAEWEAEFRLDDAIKRVSQAKDSAESMVEALLIG